MTSPIIYLFSSCLLVFWKFVYLIPSLSIMQLSLSLLELITAQEPSETVQKSIVCLPLSPCYVEPNSTEKNELSALKAGLKKVKTFADYVSAGRAKMASREGESSDGRCSDRSMDPFDTDSLEDDDDNEGQLEESKDDSSIRQPFSYETLVSTNCAKGISYSNTINNGHDECWIYYSNCKQEVGCYNTKNSPSSLSEQKPNLTRNILSWKKRKLSFKSPKVKGEPLLNKHYREEGGDDIDFDRRQLSSSDESSLGVCIKLFA